MASGSNRINFQVGFNVDKSGLNSLKSSLQELQKIKVGDFKGSAKEFAQMKIAAKEVQQALQKAFNVKLGSLNVQEFNKQLGLSTAKVNEIYTLFSKAGAQGQVAFSRMSSQILTTNVQLKQTSSLITKMGETMINTAKWTVASSVIQGFTNSIRQAFQYVQALDASLTDIRIVTGDSTEQMRQFAQQANSAAQALGRSTMDYTKAALTFYQQGLDDQSVAARTQATLQAQNITGSGEQMANYLTAVWNGYKVANEQAQLYVDKLAAVADSSASNMAQLATAMSKVAATANAMGVDVDQLNAQIATIIATTRQAPQTVGNALKTIFARINDIQAGTQDAQVSLGHYTGTMAELGINVLDASGHLRDTGQVMEEIGGKWATMSREQQIYLARTMAGQRQYNNLIALFDNWGKYSDLVNVSMESQGTLVEKNSRYMDSLGAKMQQLGAAGEKVKDALINEQDMKGLVGAGANIVNVFGSFIQSIGGARGAILGFGSIITQVFSGVIAKEINNAVINFQNLRNNAQILKQDLASTEMLGKSMGFQQGAIKQMVEAKQAIQQYYSVMDQGQINAYNGMIKEIGAAKQQVLLLNQQKAAAEKFAQSFAYSHKTMVADSETTIEVLGEVQNKIKISNEKFQELWGKLSQQGNRPQALAQLAEQFNKVTAAVGKPIQSLDSFDRFWEQLKKIKDTANPTAQELDKVKGAYNSLIKQVLQQIGDASSLNQIRKKSEQAEAGLKKAKTAAQDFVNGQAQLFDIQNTIQYISALGRVASSISNIVNITKIWKNENLSTGQKVLQTFTNLGFAIPMLISSLSKLKTVQAITATLKAKTDNAEILRNEEKILQQRKLILLQQIRAAGAAGGIIPGAAEELKQIDFGLKQISNSRSLLEQLKSQFSGITNVVQKLASKLTGLKLGVAQSFGAIAGIIAPIAISIGAVAIAIRSFYNQWNSASIAAQKAVKKAEEAKKRYNEIKQAFQELKSSFEQYDNTQDALRHLTRGTQEWRDALIQANNVVLELLNNYPLLANYIQTGQNGELSITEQGRRELINTQQRQVNAAMINSSIAARDQREASLRVDAAQLGRTFAVVAQSGLIDYSGSPELVESIARQYASGVIDRQAIAQAVADEVGYAFDTPQRAFETALRVTNTLLEENSQALSSLGHQLLASDRVMESGYNAMAQSLLSQETAYQRFTRQQQSMINGLGGQLISSEYERILQSLNNQGVNQLTQSSSLQDLLNRYMQATGQQGLSWDKNQVTEKNGEYIFHLRDANNQQVNLSQGDFYDIIAATQAQQSIRDFAFEAVESVSQGLGEGRLGEALRNWLAGQDFGNLTQNEIQLVSGFFDSLDEDVRENLASLRGMTKEQARQSIEALQNSTIESLNQARDKLSPHLSHVFDWMLETITQDLSIQQQKNLAEQLQNIYDTFGETGVSNLQDFYNSVNDLDAFEQLYEQFDPLTDSTQAFIAQLQQEGIVTNLSVDALNALIDARREQLGLLDPQGAYSSVQGLERLNYNDLVSFEDFQEIKNTLDDFGLHLDMSFFRMELGGYRFIGAAQDWIDFLNNASFQHAEQSIAQYYNRIGHINDYLNSDFYARGENTQYSYLSNDITTDTSASFDERSQIMQAQLQALQAAGLLTDQLQNIWIEIREGNDVNMQQAEAIHSAIVDNQQVFNNPEDNRDDLLDELHDLQSQVSNTLHQLDEDVDETTAGALASMLRTSEGIEGLDEDVQGLAGQAERVAEEWLRYDHALEEFYDNYQEWNSALNSNNLAEQAAVLPEIRNAYSDLLNLPIQGISENFASNADNLELFRQAANGSSQAYDQLLQLAQQDIIAHLNIDPADQINFENSLSNLQTQMDGLGDIEAGAYIDDSQALMAMNQLINSADMTAKQAQALLGSMGIDATVESVPINQENSHTFIGAQPRIEYDNVDIPSMFPYPGGVTTYRFPRITYIPTKSTEVAVASSNATALRVTSASKSSGGNIKFNNTPHGAGSAGQAARRPSGGGGGGGKSSGSTAKPSVQKPSQDQRDPYHDINRLLDKQEQKLKNIQDQDKKLVNRDRLNNINAQNKALEEQANLLENKLAIAESEQIRLRNQLLADTNGYAQFGANGQITNFNQMLANAEKQYNDYIAYYNTLSKQQQDAEKDRLDLEKERYQRVKKTADEYEETLDLQRDLLEQINEAQEKIYQNMIKQSQIRVDLAVNTGDLEREYLDFENKFIKKLDKDDFLGNAKANVKELMSYFNSDQIKKRNEEINSLNATIQRIEKNGGGAYVDPSTGYNLAAAQERLSELFKDQTKALEEIDDLVKEIQEIYLDSLKDAKDKMDDQIDQYERVGELIEHNAKLAQLIYGDKAYASLEKYYALQQRNDQRILNNLRMQQQYWQSQLDNEVVGSDAWLEIKKNLDDITDDLNNKLEDMIDRLADQWQVRAKKITDQVNNSMTGGRGLDYLNEQWDYISDYDDNFLDTLESKFGIQQVETLYQQAIDSIQGDPRGQQRLNKLMNDQLKLLREKDKLTEYDIERAKAALEVEKARMAIEQARDSKTKMRLRRDSQGNYTYQYVADENKLSDLQQALNEAQANLYSMDKEHYTQNLNGILDAWQEFQQKMSELQFEYAQADAANNEEEKKRVNDRIELLRDSYSRLFDGLTEDNQYNLKYLAQSFGQGMGFTKAQQEAEDFIKIMEQNIPHVGGEVQNLTNAIIADGGLLSALSELENGFAASNLQYVTGVQTYLAETGTTVDAIMQVTDAYGNVMDTAIGKAQEFIPYYDSMIEKSVGAIDKIRETIESVEQILDKNLDDSALVKTLETAVNLLQDLNRYKNALTGQVAKDVNIVSPDVVSRNIDTTENNAGIITAQDWKNYLNNQSTSQPITLANISAITQLDTDTLDKLSNSDLLLNVIGAVKYVTDSIGNFADREIAGLMKEASSYIGSIDNVETLNQNVHIEANFPNVTQHTQIEQAFNNLVNIAAQAAARGAGV